jgi:hypothetical protein
MIELANLFDHFKMVMLGSCIVGIKHGLLDHMSSYF